MEEKIKLRLIFIGLLSIILTAVITTFVFRGTFIAQGKDEIKLYAELIEKSYSYIKDSEDLKSFSSGKLRITLISSSGDVLFDSDVNKKDMENHLDRPEFGAALETGTGEAVRRSDTFGYDMYYYAVKLDDGNILRTAMRFNNMYNDFKVVFPIIIAVSLVVFIISVILSVILTKKLVRPLTDLADNFDDLDEESIYEELRPFVASMKEQQRKKNDLDKMKQDFTANVSHELKTPLTSISGYAEMIETGMAAEKDVKAFAGKIHHESGRLITLIGDIIKLSEINELGNTAADFETVNIYNIVVETVEALSFNASKLNISMIVSGEVCYVTGNKGMLEELIYNLCDNAIRYNKPGGGISISVNREESKVALRVKDTGIGIPQKYHDRIFERFYRVDKSRSKITGGTGLGLAIVKHIAIQHKAAITVNSKEGEGTEIIVVFN